MDLLDVFLREVQKIIDDVIIDIENKILDKIEKSQPTNKDKI